MPTVSYRTQSLDMDGKPDPNSPVSAGMILIASDGKAILWSIDIGDGAPQKGSQSGIFALNANIMPFAKEIGGGSTTGPQLVGKTDHAIVTIKVSG